MSTSALVIPDQRRLWEMVAVAITSVGKFVFMDLLNWRLPFTATAVIGWTLYVVYRNRQQPGMLAYWGFRTDTFGPVLRMVVPFAMVAIVASIAVGVVNNSINITWHILPLLITYPIWGTIQQFLTMGLVAANLQDHSAWKLKRAVVVPLTAALFSVVHYPDRWLMLGTFALALFYAFAYLRCRNLYVLGILHGWLGAFFYYMVVGRDPFVEVFGRWM